MKLRLQIINVAIIDPNKRKLSAGINKIRETVRILIPFINSTILVNIRNCEVLNFFSCTILLHPLKERLL